MLAKLKCWWIGHKIKADIVLATHGGYDYAFYCERCNCKLPGPRP